MSTPQSEKFQPIGPPNFELWTGRLWIDGSAWSPKVVQRTLKEYVAESGLNAVGYYARAMGELTLLRWPDRRAGFHVNTVEECQRSLGELATDFSAFGAAEDIVPNDRIHCLLGLQVGYDSGQFANITTIYEKLPEATIEAVEIVSARAALGVVDEYAEPMAAAVTAPPSARAKIGELATELQQHHFAIEDGVAGTTQMYQTHWAPRLGLGI